MSVMRNMKIRHKLIAVIMLTSAVALLLTAAVFVVWQRTTLRQTMVRTLSTQAEMIADNCKAALSFEDAKDAEEILSALRAEQSVVFGCVYTNTGRTFATYYRDDVDGSLIPRQPQNDGHSFDGGFLTIFRPVVLDTEKIGAVCIRSDLHPMYEMLRNNTIVIISVVLVAFLIAYLVSFALQAIISRPILTLAEVAKTVSEKKDYSTRAVKHNNDEVGLLIDAFNRMLEQIQQRDIALLGSKAQLETRVRQRTADLSAANRQLQQEIVERNRAEKRQTELLCQLEKVNQELKDFAYIVSHDLKAPLRGISTLAKWISESCYDILDVDGKEQMNLLMARVKRMHALIDGILEYSKVGRGEEKMVAVNLNELVPEVIDIIAPPKNISVIVENELPVVECDRTRITQVFQNLISNAVKYMDKPDGKIKIGCVEENGFWKFSVADNGPGIKQEHHERIFQIFQTLAPRDEFESTGVGLTVVKKIVDLYNGRIWLRSEPSQGTTFFFTWPKHQVSVKNEKL